MRTGHVWASGWQETQRTSADSSGISATGRVPVRWRGNNLAKSKIYIFIFFANREVLHQYKQQPIFCGIWPPYAIARTPAAHRPPPGGPAVFFRVSDRPTFRRPIGCGARKWKTLPPASDLLSSDAEANRARPFGTPGSCGTFDE